MRLLTILCLVLLGLSALALIGCVTYEEHLADVMGRCTDIGYTPDTDPWRDCVVATVNSENAAAAGAAVIPVVIPPPLVYPTPPIGDFSGR